jgi:hypothetical protein
MQETIDREMGTTPMVQELLPTWENRAPEFRMTERQPRAVTPNCIVVSTMRPLPGDEARVEEINTKLLDFATTLKGYVGGGVAWACDAPGELCRTTLWENEGWGSLGCMALRYFERRARLFTHIFPGRTERIFCNPPHRCSNTESR